ncbi:hypothetical protein FOTG_10235 [Fusarium oxysporum f. sp. vasinfectum 25433]|uniref:Uncharacterized protein n=1 Tax=Fusarium oxysporum f. sp. vasinfectum 25433 TaxID=1089449 RepID=X0LLP8_FUSOX|nr:hypothetical protein FOTG_10235 [Fusarium oxysporum f. sp. vasinfectum 25433]
MRCQFTIVPAKSSGERDGATSQQGGDKSGVVPETSPTLEIISCDEQWKSDNKKGLEYHKTDIGVRISTGDHFIVKTNTRFAMHRAKGLDLSQLDLTSLPIRDIPETFAKFAGNKLGFAYNFAKEAFLAEAKAYETLLINHYLNTTKYWGCHSYQQQYP